MYNSVTIRLALILAVTALAVILGFTFLQLPGHSLFWRALHNSGHGIIFAALGAVSLTVIHRHLGHPILKALLISSGVLFLLGASIELAQYASGRGASTNDMIMDSVGILSGSCLYSAVQFIKQPNSAWLRAAALLILGTVAMIWCIRWPAAYLIFAHQRPSLPVLADFENMGGQLFVSGTGSTQTVAIHDEWPANPTRSVKVKFQQGQWPNVAFREPAKNWSKYSSLMFSGYNPQNIEITMRVRIDHRRFGLSELGHMTVRQTVPPGEFTVALEFDAFKADAARQGQTDNGMYMEVDGFMVFLNGDDMETGKELVLYFDEFRLQ